MTLPEPFYASGEHLAIELPGVRALFTTRRGGVSTGPYATLNLGRFTDDDPGAVARNRGLLQGRLGVRFAYARQVHGAEVMRVTQPQADDVPHATADGQATALRGVAPMVLTADCLPIALARGSAVAMLHAGWRGLSAGVVREGVHAVREVGGGEDEVVAALGPAARVCCYEVGDEVRAEFEQVPDAGHGRYLDMAAIARHELVQAGVEVVHDCGLCTICSTDPPFFSHRRHLGVTGRQAGVAWLT